MCFVKFQKAQESLLDMFTESTTKLRYKKVKMGFFKWHFIITDYLEGFLFNNDEQRETCAINECKALQKIKNKNKKIVQFLYLF